MFVFSGLQPWPCCVEEMSPATTQLNCLLSHSLDDFSDWAAKCFKLYSCARPTSCCTGNTTLTACPVTLGTPSTSRISQLFTHKWCLAPALWGSGEPHATEWEAEGQLWEVTRPQSPQAGQGSLITERVLKSSPSVNCCQNSQRQSSLKAKLFIEEVPRVFQDQKNLSQGRCVHGDWF